MTDDLRDFAEFPRRWERPSAPLLAVTLQE